MKKFLMILASGSAVFLGNRYAHQPQFGHLSDGFHGETLLFIHFGRQRLHFIFRKRTDHLQKKLFCL